MSQSGTQGIMPLHVVVLAAGQGKRMRSAKPKVLQQIAGQPLLQHVLNTAQQLGADRITVVVGHGAERVRQAIPQADVHWAVQDPPQGTGDAVRCALRGHTPAADEITLVLYGDVPLLQRDSLLPLLAEARQGALALLTQQLEQPTGYGRIVRDEADGVRVMAIVEEKDATPAQRAIREVNTGILAGPTAPLAQQVAALSNNNAQGEYYLTDCVAAAVAAGQAVVTASPGHRWEADGVNDPWQLAQLERAWQQHQARELLLSGVRLADPARIDLRLQQPLLHGQDVDIDVGCVFEGRVQLGHGVRIEPYCVLRNCQIADGAIVRAFSHVDGADIGAGSVIGPYARLRPGTVLAEHTHVGNFVELKNAQFGEGSKANHLSYVGDATVGSGVNIGAGVITCNYDGANKHRTIIGDGAFIGSDTQLVAPVTVGAGATIGAGTTLGRDAPEHQLTLSRARQRTVPGWQRPVKKAR